MGCGASVVPPATDEQKVEMMQFALKEMMLAIGTHAITNGKDIKVPAPLDQVGKIRAFVESTRAAAKDAKAKGGSAGDGAAADLAAKAGALGGIGGGMGAMLGKVAAAADSGMAVVGDAAGSAAEATLNVVADAVEKAIQSLDDAFAKVGVEVADAKIDDIIAVYKAIINEKKVDSPQSLVRGASPHSQVEADACPKDAASNYITDKAKGDLVDKMLPVTKEVVQNSTACKSWKQVIDSYNAANEKLGSLGEVGAKLKQDAIDLDIERYIVEQIVVGYHGLMVTKEASVRANPATAAVPEKATTFARCWGAPDNGVVIVYSAFTATHYQDFKLANK